ncbi:hypothetical protein [Pseudaminobacter sp. NGMCC 1.201702]|uniref:hypothetical protein n=1 Tax=Pseudaminobacter sp. NGMCC 1.201702 TaxID=3391825 RepID=UPI0039F04055
MAKALVFGDAEMKGADRMATNALRNVMAPRVSGHPELTETQDTPRSGTLS